MGRRPRPARRALTELTVGYRTPAEVMALAAGLLPRIAPDLRPPAAVRSSGVRPWARRVPPERLGAELLAALRAELARDDAAGEERSVAAVVPEPLAGPLAAAAAPVLGPRVSLLTPAEAKGLEFDAVIVVEPALVTAPGDLYVALTRPTQRLGVLHARDLPDGLDPALLEVHRG